MTKTVKTWNAGKATRKAWRTSVSAKAEVAVPDGNTGTEPAAGTGTGAGQEPDVTTPSGREEPVTMESLMVQIRALEADNAKLKNTNNNLSSEAGTLRKQLRERMTADEQRAEAEAERLANEKATAEATKRELEILKATNTYLKMGMNEELAQDTATAAYDGDQMTVNANFMKHQAAREKDMEARIRSELMASIPAPQSGNQGGVDYSMQQNDALAALDLDAYTAATVGAWRASQK